MSVNSPTVNINCNFTKCLPRKCKICQREREKPSDTKMYSQEAVDEIIRQTARSVLSSSEGLSEEEQQERETESVPSPKNLSVEKVKKASSCIIL